MINILAFAGSNRLDSYNQKLVAVAAQGARAAGANVHLIELAALNLPLINQDLIIDHKLPPEVVDLQNMIKSAHGLLIASPEYNGFFSPLLKNSLDWASRRVDQQPSVFSGRFAAVMAASPGRLGGMRGLLPLRQLLTELGVTVLAEQMTLANAGQAFDDRGRLLDAEQQQSAEALGARLVVTLRALHL